MKEHNWLQREKDIDISVVSECKECGLIRIRANLINEKNPEYLYGFAWNHSRIEEYIDCDEAMMRKALR
jgi:hypothetical protein